MTLTPTVRAAIIGAGLMGRWHADAVIRAGGTVAYVIDADRARAEALAAACHPPAKVATNLRDIAADAPTHVLHVCTPLETHASLVAQGLEAGRHVLCEKPLTEDTRTTMDLLALAEKHGRLLCPTHQFLFQTGVQRAFRDLPKILPVLHVELVACSAGAAGRFDADEDGLVGEILPHGLAILARMFPGRVAALDWQIQHPLRGELRASGTIAATSVSILISAHGRPTVNTLRVVGSGGTIDVDLFHGFSVRHGETVSRVHKIAQPFVHSGHTLLAAGVNLAQRAGRGEVAYPGLRELVTRFYAALSGQAPAPVTAQEILEVATARDTLIARLE